MSALAPIFEKNSWAHFSIAEVNSVPISLMQNSKLHSNPFFTYFFEFLKLKRVRLALFVFLKGKIILVLKAM